MLGICGGVAVLWLALVLVLWRVRPDEARLRDAMRLLPDVARLLARLARDHGVPVSARLKLWLLLAYLALPIDLIPDFIPVVGYADDAVLVVLVLRAVVRSAGVDHVRRHWPGTDDGFDALARLVGLERSPDANNG